MRILPFRILPGLLLGGACLAQVVQLPAVVDRNLANGLKVLMVERPGTGAVRAGLFIRGGRAATGNLSPAAADLLARTLFRREGLPGESRGLEGALRQEGATFEALRTERLRGARQPESLPQTEGASLQAIHDQAMATLRAALDPVPAWDAVDDLGGTRRVLEVSADGLAQSVDLPAASLEGWLRLEARRLANPPLERFPLERQRLLEELRAGMPPCPPSLSVLLGTALTGRRYAQCCEFQRSDLEALTLNDLRNFGREVLRPGRITLVLVGDFRHETLLVPLEATFGKLVGPAEGTAPRFMDDDPGLSLESPAGRQMVVSTAGETRVLLAWRVPPSNHPDMRSLRALAQVLAGSPSSRLIQGLVTSRGIARNLSLTLGVPGERDPNLLTIDAEPAPGHSLAELQQAILGEVLRLQREPIPESEVHRVQVQLEAQQIQAQEDATSLVRVLGQGQCRGGDWRVAFQSLSAAADLTSMDIQGAARTYLVPSRGTFLQFGPDPLLLPRDAMEARLVQVLTALVQRKMEDPMEVQAVLREALRQLRMLSPEERQRTLRLLESQVTP
jgi:predicted Zn-dependent peptidase